MMSGALIETEARNILQQGIQQGISEAKEKMAVKLLKRGKLTVEEIAEDTGLSVEEIEQLAGLQTM
jgi:predicted transposase/invertase (TIGR01784 family)